MKVRAVFTRPDFDLDLGFGFGFGYGFDFGFGFGYNLEPTETPLAKQRK